MIDSSNLKNWEPDLRDFLFHDRYQKKYGQVAPTIPIKTLNRQRKPVLDQGVTDECTDYMLAKRAEYRYNLPFSHRWQGAKEGEIMNASIINGADPRSVLKAPITFGSLPLIYDPFNDNTPLPTYLNWRNYDLSLDKNAVPYLEQAYELLEQTQGLDPFDSVRLGLYLNENSSETAPVFSKWYEEWNHTTGMVPMPTSQSTLNHAHLAIDFDTIDGTDVLVHHMSQGTEIGDNGFLYFPRDVVNSEIEKGNMAFYIFTTNPTAKDIQQAVMDLEGEVVDFLQRILAKIKGQ